MEFIVKLTRQEIDALVSALDLAIAAEINLEDQITADPTGDWDERDRACLREHGYRLARDTLRDAHAEGEPPPLRTAL
jgi:hypothetical protein